MQERTYYAAIAGAGIVAGATLMALVDRAALKTDLAFLGIAQRQVEEALAELKKRTDEDNT